MDTGRGTSHTGVCWREIEEGQQGVGSWGDIAWGEMPDIGEGEEGSKSHCHVCTYAQLCMFFTCTPKPKMQFKKRKNNKNKFKNVT